MDTPYYNGEPPDDAADGDRADRHGAGECECHCHKCGAALEECQYADGVYASCGDCYGGAEPDGEAFRGGEAAAYEAEQMARIQRRLK